MGMTTTREMLPMMHDMVKLSSQPGIIGFGPVCTGLGLGGKGTPSADTTVWPCLSSSTSPVCWALVKAGLRRERRRRKDGNGSGEILGIDIFFRRWRSVIEDGASESQFILAKECFIFKTAKATWSVIREGVDGSAQLRNPSTGIKTEGV